MHVDSWRKGRVDFLERVIQGNLSKISSSMAMFRRWALQKGLNPSETAYVRTGRSGTLPIRFSQSGDPAIEKEYRTHYVSPALSERKQQALVQKLDRAPKPVAFETVRDAQCSECGAEMAQGSLLFMEAEQPLCMQCAGLSDLEYLASGNMALTRRATKISERVVVVVRFSRSRKRCERQGILVEIAAIEKAERECLEDAGEREAARVRGAEERRKEDRKLVLRITERIRELFPGCSPQELTAISEHTAQRGSGRVGRTQAGRNLENEPLIAAVRAAVRHKYTNYDEMLGRGMDRMTARGGSRRRSRKFWLHGAVQLPPTEASRALDRQHNSLRETRGLKVDSIMFSNEPRRRAYSGTSPAVPAIDRVVVADEPESKYCWQCVRGSASAGVDRF